MAAAKKEGQETADPKEVGEKAGLGDLTETRDEIMGDEGGLSRNLGQVDFTGVHVDNPDAAESQALELALAARGVPLHQARERGVIPSPTVVSRGAKMNEWKIEGLEGSTKIRVRESIDSMVFGAGNVFSFEPGIEYTVPTDVANHLESKGMVYH